MTRRFAFGPLFGKVFAPMLRALFAAVLLSSPALAVTNVTSTFANNDASGWTGSNGGGGVGTFIDSTDGTPAPSLRTQFEDFFLTFENGSAAWAGDYTAQGPFTFSVGVNSRLVNFFGQDVTRDLVLELRDLDNPNGGYPWTSVYYALGEIGTNSVNGAPGWNTLSVTVADPTSAALPAGWGGYGDENANAEPILPPGRTFANVLAGVDEAALITLRPGFVSGFVNYDLALDNISLQFNVPEPGALLALGGAAGMLIMRRR